jgi:hypothetical protein
VTSEEYFEQAMGINGRILTEYMQVESPDSVSFIQNEFIGISTLTVMHMLAEKTKEIHYESLLTLVQMIVQRGESEEKRQKVKRYGCFDGLAGYLHALLLIEARLSRKLNREKDSYDDGEKAIEILHKSISQAVHSILQNCRVNHRVVSSSVITDGDVIITNDTVKTVEYLHAKREDKENSFSDTVDILLMLI